MSTNSRASGPLELVAIQDRGLQLPIIDASGSISETVDAVLGTIG